MTPSIKLTSSQIHSIVSENKYRVTEESQFVSRCIDGRYSNESTLPALSIPGADMGDLAILYATKNEYAFEVDTEKAFTSFETLVGSQNIRWHTDDHEQQYELGTGCGHLTQLFKDPSAYSLEQQDIVTLKSQLQRAQKDGGKEIKVKGGHHEAAVVMIKGPYGVLPRYQLDTDEGQLQVELFTFHQTLVNARHRAWCELLINTGAVKLFNNLDEEYLYEVLSSTTDDHLFKTLKRLAKELPIYQVTFSEDGSFEIKQEGFV